MQIKRQAFVSAEEHLLGEQSYKYLTVDEMKSLGDDSVAIDVTSDEKHMRQEQINQQKQVMRTACLCCVVG